MDESFTTLILYLTVESVAIYILFCVDSTVSEKKRLLIQQGKTSAIRPRETIIMQRHICFVASFFILFALSALRDNIGWDYGEYIGVYYYTSPPSAPFSFRLNAWLAPGFVFICKMLGYIDPRNYYLMFATVAFLTLRLIFKAIYKMSCDWAMSLYLFVSFCIYYQSFNQIRQVLALSVTTYAMYFLTQNNVKKYLFYVFIAFLCHNSAIIMAGMCIIYKWRINVWNLLMYLGICVLSQIGYIIVARILGSLPYGGYLNSGYGEAGKLATILKSGAEFVMLIGCLIFSKRTIKRSPHTVVFYNAVLVCFIFRVLSMRAFIISRLTLYFQPAYFFLMPEVLKSAGECFDRISMRLLKLFFVFMFLIYHIFYYFNSWYQPYKMINLF